MIYTIQNDELIVDVLDQGASILSMKYFDGEQWHETTLQYENLEDYTSNNSYYLNSVIGPHSGRIKDGQYHNGSDDIQLEVNDGDNHLHGGKTGFHTLKFVGELTEDKTCLTLKAKDTVNKCDLTLRFKLDGSSLNLSYDVAVYKTQVMNMTQHTYFNLSGEPTIKNHRILVPADYVCYLDNSGAPKELVEVEGSFDLRSSVQLSEKMSISNKQFKVSGNIDHPFLVNDGSIQLESDLSKIGVAVSSNRPYAVVYTGNYFLQENDFQGLGPSILHQAVAIEPQYLPNDINLNLGENQLVLANEHYYQEISYRFYKI